MKSNYVSGRRLFVNGVLIAALLFTSLMAIRPLISSNAQQTKTNSKAKATSQQSLDTDLRTLLDKTIAESELGKTRLGVSVMSADGNVVYERNAQDLFVPASNMKVYTTAVALDLLGADYRWRTSVYAQKQPTTEGLIEGDLVLYGRGAPDLISRSREGNDSSLSRLAADLYARGVRRVKGDVVGDESYFRGNSLGDGWQWTDIQWYFGAEASALSIDENELDVNVTTASNDKGKATVVTSAGNSSQVQIDNQLAFADGATRPTIGLFRGLSDNKITVWGELPARNQGFGARLSIHNPALWASNLFADALRKQGITVDGKSYGRSSRTAPSERFDTSKAVELTSVTSATLAEIVRRTNKVSHNLFAELILRTLGRERGAMLTSPEPPGRERGDDESGVALIRLWMGRSGIAVNNMALHDGSGLSRLNLVTPESTTRLLLAISKTASSGAFHESLPIAGKDGTLGGRLRNVNERVRAKTGSLTYTSSLSGYATTPEGKTYTFSIYCNDFTRAGSPGRIIDSIVTAIAAGKASAAK